MCMPSHLFMEMRDVMMGRFIHVSEVCLKVYQVAKKLPMTTQICHKC